MNIVCLFGSPRKQGNSATVARRFLQRAEQHGANVRSYYLNDLSYRGCQACDACKTHHERCVLKDDLAPVLDAVFEADLIVMTSRCRMFWRRLNSWPTGWNWVPACSMIL